MARTAEEEEETRAAAMKGGHHMVTVTRFVARIHIGLAPVGDSDATCFVLSAWEQLLHGKLPSWGLGGR